MTAPKGPSWLFRARRRKPHPVTGHAWYCDCGKCLGDGGRAQRTRRYGCPCDLPVSMCPPGYVTHYEPDCPKRGARVYVT